MHLKITGNSISSVLNNMFYEGVFVSVPVYVS